MESNSVEERLGRRNKVGKLCWGRGGETLMEMIYQGRNHEERESTHTHTHTYTHTHTLT